MSKCKQCGAIVRWIREQGRWRCLNVADAKDHWDQCSRRRWQQVKETGERFETKEASGYRNSIHGTKYDRIAAKPIRGALYREPSGKCKDCVPPWEACAECPDQFLAA